MISEERLEELWTRTGHIIPPTLMGAAFARAVEAEAYEAAKKVCDGIDNEHWKLHSNALQIDPKYAERYKGIAEGAVLCAAAIRALKDKS